MTGVQDLIAKLSDNLYIIGSNSYVGDKEIHLGYRMKSVHSTSFS